MGCKLSIPRPQPSSDDKLDKSPPKLFDSRSLSCRSLSSPISSIEIKSPIITIVPPSPPKQTVHLVEAEKPPLDLPTSEINNQIRVLTSTIQDSISLLSESRHQTLSDLDAILSLVSEATLVYTKLEILASRINALYREKHSLTEHLRLVCDELPLAWTALLRLDEEEQRRMARTQSRDSPLMRIFAMLGEVRRACEVLQTLDAKVERGVAVAFEEILGELKRVGPEEAALKWRVLGIVVGRRRQLLVGSVGEILEVRLRVSGTLVGVVDVLAEVDEE